MQLLNAPFTKEEIICGIEKLNSNKAPGIDRVLNKFLKTGKEVLSSAITVLFNEILESGKYPEQWSVNILSTIHKGGCKDNLDNYRGISVSSCFGKLYGSLLSNRLEQTINKFELIGPHQVGFLKGHRTADHVFVVKAHFHFVRNSQFASDLRFANACKSNTHSKLVRTNSYCSISQ